MNPEESIVKTLIYSDIFDYPLRKEEIWKYLINIPMSQTALPLFDQHSFFSFLQKKSSFYSSQHGYFFLKGKDTLVVKRLEHEKISRDKLKGAEKVAKILFMVPTVLLVGLSGSLAMLNADETADIDFFIITRKGTLWISRLLIILVLHFLGKRRKRDHVSYSDLVCVNMWMDEGALQLGRELHDLYLAHEIVQMKPLFWRESIYEQFLSMNSWVLKFLPNSFDSQSFALGVPYKRNIFLDFFCRILFPFEYIAQKGQFFYMQRHRTVEVVKHNYAAFHPFNYRKWVLRTFREKLRDLS